MRSLVLAIATASLLTSVTPSLAVAPEYRACNSGKLAACKQWRDRSCKDDANPAACDYDEARKQKDPIGWCQQRYPDNAPAYRWCANGSPDR
jgi:hypothetical protein